MAISDQEFDFVSQNAHLCGGALFVLAPYVFWGPTGAAAGGAIGTVLTAVKEGWYDYHYETPEVRGSSLRDWAFYMMGIGAAATLVLIRMWPQ